MNGYLGNKKTRTAYELERLIQPTHFVTVNFKKGRKIESDLGFATFRYGDDVIYLTAADAILRSASKRLVSQSIWRRHKPLIRSVFALEGGKLDGRKEVKSRPHVHFAVRAPKHLTPEAFVYHFHKAARGNPWVLKGYGTIDIKPCESPTAAVAYFLKEGTGRFMIAGSGSLDVASN